MIELLEYKMKEDWLLIKEYRLCKKEIEENADGFGFLRIKEEKYYTKRLNCVLNGIDKYENIFSNPLIQEYIKDIRRMKENRSEYPASFLFFLLSNELYDINEIIVIIQSEHTFSNIQKKYEDYLNGKKSNNLYRRKFYYKITTKNDSKNELIEYLENNIKKAKSLEEAESYYYLCSSYPLIMLHNTRIEGSSDQKIQIQLEYKAISKIYNFLNMVYYKKMTLDVIEKATKQEILRTKNLLKWTIYKNKYPFESEIIKNSVKEYLDCAIHEPQKITAELLLIALPSELTETGKQFLEEVMKEMNRKLSENKFINKFIKIGKKSEPLVSEFKIRGRELVYKEQFKGNWEKARYNEKKLLNDNLPNDIMELFKTKKKETYIENKQIIDSYNNILREAENEIRVQKGLPRVGEGWISETELYNMVKEYLKGKYNVFHGAHLDFLGKQHLDIYIPKIALGIEYQGEQHFKPVEIFGGKEGFKAIKKRDKRKKLLCEKNDVHLVYVEEGYDFNNLKKLIDSRIKEKDD